MITNPMRRFANANRLLGVQALYVPGPSRRVLVAASEKCHALWGCLVDVPPGRN